MYDCVPKVAVSGLALAGGQVGAGDAEVEDLHLAVLGDEEVRRA
jgi:hypothetical protein